MTEQPGYPRSGWAHSKSLVISTGGMVATRHPLAAEAGVSILEAGGNAMDAAVASSLASGVVQPLSNTLGGGGFLVVHSPEDGAHSIDYRYEASENASEDMFDLDDAVSPDGFGWVGVHDRSNEIGHRSVAVPGSVPGLAFAVDRFGTMPFAAVLEPALQLATDGFEMDWYGSLMQGVHLDLLTANPTTARIYLREGGLPYRPRVFGAADVHRQPELAKTLASIQSAGPDVLRRGPVADSIVSGTSRGGGLMTPDDLDGYAVREATPNVVRYRGHTVFGPPNMAAFVQILAILEQLDIGALEPADPLRLHLIAETLFVVKREQAMRYGDAQFLDSSWDELRDPDRTTELLGQIHPRRHTGPQEGLRSQGGSRHRNTIHISAADGSGTLVSLTETVLGNFGSGVTTETGILLNNGMAGFDPRPGRPNSIRPRRRPLSNMTPIVVADSSGRGWLTLGASGGPKIVGAVVQVLSHLVDCGMDIQQAIAAPRVDVEGDAIVLDARFGSPIAGALEDLGHEVIQRTEDLSSFEFANPSGVAIGPDGFLYGGANPYQLTEAVGYPQRP